MIYHVDADDVRLAPYQNLKEKDLARQGNRFIAEGEQVVRRLIHSSLRVESVLVAQRKAESISPLVEGRCDMLVAPDAVIQRTLGFAFHSGVIACGIRPEPVAIESLIREGDVRTTLLVCPETNNTENLGSLIRIAAAFGLDGILLGPRSCDPYFRQAVRVSMGTVFSMPIVRATHLQATLQSLRASHHFELLATALDAHAAPLRGAQRGQRLAILVGSEANGLAVEDIALCDRKICIPMQLGTDSLNVAVATGIVVHHFAYEV